MTRCATSRLVHPELFAHVSDVLKHVLVSVEPLTADLVLFELAMQERLELAIAGDDSPDGELLPDGRFELFESSLRVPGMSDLDVSALETLDEVHVKRGMDVAASNTLSDIGDALSLAKPELLDLGSHTLTATTRYKDAARFTTM
jgi:hypothetical protein